MAEPVTGRGQAGFTLIEVLVAFLVLTLAVSVLFHILSGGLRNIEQAQQYARAAMLAEELMAETGLSRPLDLAEDAGESEDRLLRWSRRVEPYQAWETDLRESTLVTGYRVEVSVDWGEGKRLRQLDLQSIRLQRARTSGG